MTMGETYKLFIVIAFLFFFGTTVGWTLELFYRRFISPANKARLWLNPGFLTGPCLPVYGFGVIVLYVLSLLESYITRFDSGGLLHYILMFFVMALAMTAVEYVAGIIFIKGLHIKLWDYSTMPGNIQGIICPQYTLAWGILSALYYFFLFPKIHALVLWFLEHPWFSFVVGMAFGIFLIDCAFSLKFGTLLRKRAREIDRKAALNYQLLQSRLGQLKLSGFVSPHASKSLTSYLDSFEEFVKRSPDSVTKN